MKKIIFLISIFALSITTYAQNTIKKDSIQGSHVLNNENKIDYMDNTSIKRQEPITTSSESQRNCCMVKNKDNNMFCMEKDKTTSMEKNMVFKNGTILKINGEVKTKDGKTVQLQNGDCVDMDGNIMLFKKSIIKEDNEEMMMQK